ncbi:glycosyltransferase family 2 protein [Xanthomarina sp.]|uniref:glycosyltransferase family 2 protein n=1 Tax=Xanthomarina sp. TaxID=1931211 RepID=UPI002CE31EC9|nr:glycosyltransferase family 2 protein [Xanthomarina sp.]HLV40543.1 glycosyltransferase family 2 protein [Xanthomarina sp.]
MNVSVIIPVYNAAAFLERAVKSALIHKEVKEVLLIEDGSKDNSLQVCKRLSEQFEVVKLFQHPDGQNLGAGATRNLGILNATQEYISFLDADDYFTEIRFKKEKEIFKNHTDADGVYGAIGVEYIDETGAKAWQAKGHNETMLTTVNKEVDPDHLFEFLIGYNKFDGYKGYFHLDGFTVKRKAILKNKLFFDSSLRLHQDTAFFWKSSYLLRYYTGEFQEPLAIRGIHATNRFIHAKNLNKSRSKMYRVMREWSMDNKLDDNVIKHFDKIFFKYFISSKPKIEKPFFYLKILLTDKYIRGDFGKRQLRFIWKQLR